MLKGHEMKDYVKTPEINTGEMPSLEENEELNRTVPEKQKKI